LFILIGTGAIFYSAGWRLTMETCETETLADCLKIQRTGAILVEAKQKGISISIAEKVFKDKAGLIQAGTLISNLLPRDYYVEIIKDGYRLWQKNVEVEPQLVSKLSGIILVPEKPDARELPISEEISDFSINGNGDAVFESSGAIYYYNSKTPSLKLRGDEFISWNSDNSSFITKDSSKNVLYLYKTSDLSKIFNISASFGNLKKNSPITEISFHPADPDKIIVQTKNGLDIFDSARLKLETANAGKVISWTVDNPNLYYLKEIKNGTSTEGTDYGIFSFNLILKNETLVYLFSESNGFNPAEVLTMSAKGKGIIILGENDFITLNLQEKKIDKISAKARLVVFSPDGKKAAIVEADDNIIVYPFEDATEELRKKTGETIEFNAYSASLGVKNIAWHKSSKHVLVEYKDGDGNSTIGFSEIDYRLPINSYVLAQGSDMNYDSQQNKLYFIQEGKLKVLDLEAF
jgi:hypothetical protein